MSMLEAKVAAFLKRHSFKLENKKMVVGVSGGPDSLVLLHYLLMEREKRNLSLVVAHVDHMFRGQESYEDAMFVKSFCEQHRIPFEMARVNVPEIIKTTGKSSENAAREVRYDFYLQVMEKYEYSYLALGHHGDDQIETILMRLTRGSSGKARAGIPFSRPFHHGTIFRPFLGLTKAEIEQYCQRNNLSPRIDETNALEIYSRNRYRKQILPFLKVENSHVHTHFQRFSEELQADEDFLQQLTERQMKEVIIVKEESRMTIDIKRFLQMPLPLQRRGIQLILNYLYNEKPASLSALHIDQVFSLIDHHEPSGKLDFPNGLKVIRSYFRLSFQLHLPTVEPYLFEIQGPGEIELPSGGKIQVNYSDGDLSAINPYTALFKVDCLNWPIMVRTRKSGDRMTLKGMRGSKKIKDIFIDQKVPIEDRDIWPVVTDKEDCVLWLPGLKKSSFEGKDHQAKQYIQLTYNK